MLDNIAIWDDNEIMVRDLIAHVLKSLGFYGFAFAYARKRIEP